MATNQRFSSLRTRSLPVPDSTGSGVPVQVGSFVGLTVTKEGGGGNPAGFASVALDGAFDLLVTTSTELAVGDPVYITPDGDLTTTDDDGANTVFGTALSVKGEQAEVIEVEVGPSVASQPGASSETDGVGAMFFGGFGLDVGLDGVKVYTDFVPTDEPPRAPNRDDLMAVDGEDNTTLNVVKSGLYDISLNVPIGPKNINAYAAVTPVEIHGYVTFEVNGDESEFPITAYNNHAWWKISEAGFVPPVTLSLTFPQVLLVGDTIKLGFKAIQDYHDDDPLNGNLGLHPDITLLCTYRGPVTLSA